MLLNTTFHTFTYVFHYSLTRALSKLSKWLREFTCTSLKTWCAWAQSLHSCLTLCDPRTVAHQAALSMGILQARILEWVAMPSSRGSSWPRDRTCISCVPCTAGWFFTTEPLSTWGACLLRKDVTASCSCSASIQFTPYWTDQASRAVFVAHSLIHLFEFSSCHWPVVVFQKQSMVKFKVIGQGSWWSKENISIVFSDIEAEFEERQTGRPSDSDGLNQLLPSSASLPARVLWVWDLGNPYSVRLFSLAVGLTWMEGEMGVTTGHWAFVHVKGKDTKLEQLLLKACLPHIPTQSSNYNA